MVSTSLSVTAGSSSSFWGESKVLTPKLFKGQLVNCTVIDEGKKKFKYICQ